MQPKADQDDLTAHTGDKNNPHSVTAAQTGGLPTTGGTMTGPIVLQQNGSPGFYVGINRDFVRPQGTDDWTNYELHIGHNTSSSGVPGIWFEQNGAAKYPIKLRGIAEPTHNNDAANKGYVDTAINGRVPTSRTVNGKALSSNISLTASDVSALPTSGGTITGNLTLKGSGNYGNKINFGDGDYVHLYELSDDNLEIKAKNISFLSSNPLKGAVIPHLAVTINASDWVSSSPGYIYSNNDAFFLHNSSSLTYESYDFVFSPRLVPSDPSGDVSLLADWHCISKIGFEFASGQYYMVFRCLYKKPSGTIVIDCVRLRTV